MKSICPFIFFFLLFTCHQECSAQYEDILERLESQYPEPIKISPDHSKLLLRSKGEERFYLIVLNLENNTSDTIHVSQINPFSLTWHPNSNEIYFQQRSERNRRYDLHHINMAVKTNHILDVPQSSNAIPPLVFNDDGSKLAYLALSTIFIINTSNYKIEHSYSGFSRFSDFHWRTNDELLVSRYKKGEIAALRNGRTIVYFGNEDFEKIQKLVISNDTLFLQARRKSDQFYSIFKIYNQEIKRIETPGDATNLKKTKHIVSYGYLENGQVKMLEPYVINIEGSFQLLDSDEKGVYAIQRMLTCPPKVIYIRNKKKSVKTIYKNNKKYCFDRPNLLTRTRKDNSSFPVWLWDSKKRKASKTVLYLHGGPHLLYPPTWDAWISLLVDHNYRVVIPNYQGSTGFGKELERRSDLVEKKDIIQLINYLQEDYDLKLNELIIVGSSYGARIAFSMTKHFSEIGGLVSISGALNNNVSFDNDSKVHRIVSHYGTWDDHTLSNAQKFLESEGLADSNLSVHSKEGHVFYQSGTWAKVWDEILKME